MTWNIFVWAVTLVRRSLSADLMEFFLRHTGQIHLLLYVVPPGNPYYIADSFGNAEIVKFVSDQEVFGFPDLYSIQEEADTRMILQALHADKRLKELGKCTTLSFSRLDGVFFTSYRSNTSATICAFAKHDVNCLQ
jgi:hypothetical protein